MVAPNDQPEDLPDEIVEDIRAARRAQAVLMTRLAL